MKSKIYMISFITIWLLSSFCTRDKSSLNPSNLSSARGSLIIKTNEMVYSWKKATRIKETIIQGTLRNISSKTYYSKLGDFYNSSSTQLQELPV